MPWPRALAFTGTVPQNLASFPKVRRQEPLGTSPQEVNLILQASPRTDPQRLASSRQGRPLGSQGTSLPPVSLMALALVCGVPSTRPPEVSLIVPAQAYGVLGTSLPPTPRLDSSPKTRPLGSPKQAPQKLASWPWTTPLASLGPTSQRLPSPWPRPLTSLEQTSRG